MFFKLLNKYNRISHCGIYDRNTRKLNWAAPAVRAVNLFSNCIFVCTYINAIFIDLLNGTSRQAAAVFPAVVIYAWTKTSKHNDSYLAVVPNKSWAPQLSLTKCKSVLLISAIAYTYSLAVWFNINIHMKCVYEYTVEICFLCNLINQKLSLYTYNLRYVTPTIYEDIIYKRWDCVNVH